MQLTGFVYILRHPCMPGLLKIGFTSRTVAVRKSELEAPTGVPGPFVVAWQMSVYGIAVEHEAHRRLNRWREVGNREFVRCSVLRAKLVIWAANRDYGRQVSGGRRPFSNALELFTGAKRFRRERRDGSNQRAIAEQGRAGGAGAPGTRSARLSLRQCAWRCW